MSPSGLTVDDITPVDVLGGEGIDSWPRMTAVGDTTAIHAMLTTSALARIHMMSFRNRTNAFCCRCRPLRFDACLRLCRQASGYLGWVFVILLPWIPIPAIRPFWPKMKA